MLRDNVDELLPRAVGGDRQALATLLETFCVYPRPRQTCVQLGEMVDLLKSAIQKLPGSYRRVVELFDIEGRRVDEIASALARSPGAAYMLRARAHDRLREILGSSSIPPEHGLQR